MQSKDGSITDYRIAASVPLSQGSVLQPNLPDQTTTGSSTSRTTSSSSSNRRPPPYTRFILYEADTLPLDEIPLSSVQDHEDISTMPMSVWSDDFWTARVQPIVKEMEDFDCNCNWILLLLICLYVLTLFLFADQLDGRPLAFSLLTGTLVVILCVVRRWMGRVEMTFVHALTQVCRQAEADTFRRYGYALECRLVSLEGRDGDERSARLAIFFIPVTLYGSLSSSPPLLRLLDASSSRGYLCMDVLQYTMCMWSPVSMSQLARWDGDISSSSIHDASIALWTTKFWPAFCTNCQSILTFHRWIFLPYVVTLIVVLSATDVARDMASDKVFTIMYSTILGLGVLIYLRWFDLKYRIYTLTQDYAADFERNGVYLELKKVIDGDQGMFGLLAVDVLYVIPLLPGPTTAHQDHHALVHSNDLV